MKNEQPEPAAWSQILLGLAVIVFWIFKHIGYAGALVIFGAFFLAGAGSDPGGPPSKESVYVLIQGFKIGVVISALAGIPAGYAVMLPRGERKSVFFIFLGMLATGLLIQIGSVVYFYTAN